MKKRLFLPAFTLFFLILFYVSSAQQNWVHHTGKTAVTLEIVKPFFGSYCPTYFACNEYDVESSNLYLGGFVPIAPRLALVAELPVATYSARAVIPFEGTGTNTNASMDILETPSGTVIGNPLIGAAYALKQAPLSFVLATRIPITGGEYSVGELFAMNAGRFADFERKDAFVRNANPLLTSVSYRFRPAGMAHSLKLAMGGKWVFYAGGTTTNAQVYSATADLNFSPYMFRATYMVYTIDGYDHLQDLFGISAAVHLGRFTPGVGYRWLAGDVMPFYAPEALTLNLTYRYGD